MKITAVQKGGVKLKGLFFLFMLSSYKPTQAFAELGMYVKTVIKIWYSGLITVSDQA